MTNPNPAGFRTSNNRFVNLSQVVHVRTLERPSKHEGCTLVAVGFIGSAESVEFAIPTQDIRRLFDMLETYWSGA